MRSGGRLELRIFPAAAAGVGTEDSSTSIALLLGKEL